MKPPKVNARTIPLVNERPLRGADYSTMRNKTQRVKGLLDEPTKIKRQPGVYQNESREEVIERILKTKV